MWALLVLIGAAAVSAHLQDLAFNRQKVFCVTVQNDEQVEIMNSLDSNMQQRKYPWTTIVIERNQSGLIGPNKKAIFMDCGFHAREWISPAFCQWFTKENSIACAASKLLASLYNTKYTYDSGAKTIYPAAGGSNDWAYDQGIKYPFTFELDTGRYGFLLPESHIKPIREEALLAVGHIAHYVLEHLH
ncbi:LOW QUALITY PROTEIN: carboxypeptidase B [Aegotheles albertisi]